MQWKCVSYSYKGHRQVCLVKGQPSYSFQGAWLFRFVVLISRIWVLWSRWWKREWRKIEKPHPLLRNLQPHWIHRWLKKQKRVTSTLWNIIQPLKRKEIMLYATWMDLKDTLLNEISHLSSVTQLCPTLGDPMNCSTPGLPVHHQLLESTQTHVHWVGDAIQPSHPLSSPSQSFSASGSFPMSQLFASGGQRIGVSASISVLPMNTQDWSPLGWTGWILLQSKGLSKGFSNINSSVLSFLYSPTLTSIHDYWKNHSLD